jgi:hypothetical protein
MNRNHIGIPFLLITLLLCACTSDPMSGSTSASKESDKTCWHSEYHNVDACYSSNWFKTPSPELKDYMLLGLVDLSDGKSYSIKIEKDPGEDQFTDLEYLLYIEDLMLSENPDNVLLSTENITYHNESYSRQVFLLNTDKWGWKKTYVHMNRSEGFITGIQFSYPFNSKDSVSDVIPMELLALESQISIRE